MNCAAREGCIRVTVRAFAMLHDVVPAEDVVEVPRRSSVGDLLSHLSARHPGLEDALFAAGELRAYVNILKGGRNIHFSGGLATPLSDSDIVALFPPAAGG